MAKTDLVTIFVDVPHNCVLLVDDSTAKLIVNKKAERQTPFSLFFLSRFESMVEIVHAERDSYSCYAVENPEEVLLRVFVDDHVTAYLQPI
jgi:hypothetical protein